MSLEWIFLAVVFAVLLWISWRIMELTKAIRRDPAEDQRMLLEQLRIMEQSIQQDIKTEAVLNRKEWGEQSSAFREETSRRIQEVNLNLSDQMLKMLQSNQQQFETIRLSVEVTLKEFRDMLLQNDKESRQSLNEQLLRFSEQLNLALKDYGDRLRERFDQFDRYQKEQNEGMGQRLLDTRQALEKAVVQMQEGNEKKLEEMRVTVDEKLQKTLNERLSQSFETVGKQLQQVQEGLGEMKNLAQDVGGLKKVLSNVKLRGGFGEIQLSMLLENLLAPDQYEANVKLRPNAQETVEFAIRLPGRDADLTHIWLPIDAKFPKDVYEQLQDAYDEGDLVKIAGAQKNLDNTIRKMAKDIRDKYIHPPYSTDFAILFLPFEGIYGEVVRKAALLEELQRDYKVVVTGPTTLAAILNSLQMGFRTLAIQRKSSEVWNILGAVKKEFESFSGLLTRAQKNIQTGLTQLEDVVGKRSRAIERKLRDVDALSLEQTREILPELTQAELEEDED